MESKNENYKLRQENWAALQELYGKLYEEENNGASEDRQFWHYTSGKGVLGIFSEYIKNNSQKKYVDYCSVLASNIRFMNDSKEYEEGMECFENLCNSFSDEKVKELFSCELNSVISDSIYLISFCDEGDLLSQWKWYGKNSGISVRFNIEDIAYRTYEYKNNDGEKQEFDFSDPHTKPLKIKYEEKDKREYFEKLLEQDKIRDSKAYKLAKLAFVPFCKHEGFKEEKESRLVFYIGDLDIGDNIQSQFNIEYNTFEEGRIKPALNVKMELNNTNECTKNIISEMIVGPGANQELVFNFLIHAFDRNYYYYHNNSENALQKELEWDQFVSFNDHKVYLVICKDKKVREAYKCENGIVIMKSAIPFRG